MYRLKNLAHLVLLLSILPFTGCDKDTYDPVFDDLRLDLEITTQSDGDILFTYIEENLTENRIDYSRSTSCPLMGLRVYHSNGDLVDILLPDRVCTSDVPRGFLEGDSSSETEASWFDTASHTALDPGTYSAEVHVGIGLVHFPDTGNETEEWDSFVITKEFTVN